MKIEYKLWIERDFANIEDFFEQIEESANSPHLEPKDLATGLDEFTKTFSADFFPGEYILNKTLIEYPAIKHYTMHSSMKLMASFDTLYELMKDNGSWKDIFMQIEDFKEEYNTFRIKELV